jgi:hypothetical protein
MKKGVIIAILCLLPFAISCDSSDDITDIFIGKTWKFNYITTGTGKTWYKFSDVTQANYDLYANRTNIFTIAFSGMQSGDIISGTFLGSGSVTASGTWTANGNSRDFSTSVTSGTVNDKTDIIAEKILYGLKNAKSYKGDIYNLYLYFDYKGESLYLAFSPK